MTGWEPHKLYKIQDFCYNIDKQRPDHFEFLKETGKLPADLENKEDMELWQRDIYENYIT